MFLFTRHATVSNVANLPAAMSWAAEMTAYVNKTYHLDLKTGVQLFGTPTVHWHFQTDNLDKITTVNQKMMQDRSYVAMLEKVKSLWLDGSMKDEIIQIV